MWHLSLMVIPSLLTCCWCNSWLSGLLITLAVACSLEFKDVLWSSKIDFTLKNILKLKWTVFDLKDWIATIIGGILGLIIFFII
jgi:hypothetical protein